VQLSTEKRKLLFQQIIWLLYSCMTILPMLTQKNAVDQWCRILSGRVLKFTQVHCKFNQSWYLS